MEDKKKRQSRRYRFNRPEAESRTPPPLLRSSSFQYPSPRNQETHGIRGRGSSTNMYSLERSNSITFGVDYSSRNKYRRDFSDGHPFEPLFDAEPISFDLEHEEGLPTRGDRNLSVKMADGPRRRQIPQRRVTAEVPSFLRKQRSTESAGLGTSSESLRFGRSLSPRSFACFEVPAKVVRKTSSARKHRGDFWSQDAQQTQLLSPPSRMDAVGSPSIRRRSKSVMLYKEENVFNRDRNAKLSFKSSSEQTGAQQAKNQIPLTPSSQQRRSRGLGSPFYAPSAIRQPNISGVRRKGRRSSDDLPIRERAAPRPPRTPVGTSFFQSTEEPVFQDEPEEHLPNVVSEDDGRYRYKFPLWQDPSDGPVENTEAAIPLDVPSSDIVGKIVDPIGSAVTNSEGLKYQTLDVIGHGMFGVVYSAIDVVSGKLLAVKRLRSFVPGQKGSDTPKMSKETQKMRDEMNLMSSLDHPFIVRYLGYRLDDGNLELCMEYLTQGSVVKMYEKIGRFNESLIRKFTLQITLGMEYLHDKGIIHRDIKGANVLVTEGGDAKLGDFGCSKQVEICLTTSLHESLSRMRGSVPWMAPEVVHPEGRAEAASDIWSLGATVIEMATATHPWPMCENALHGVALILQSKKPPPYPEGFSELGCSLLDMCLQRNPEDRCSATELKKHKYLQSLQ